MTMPKWHETMRPVLEALAHVDGYLAGTDLQDAVAIEFDMTDAVSYTHLTLPTICSV